MRVNLHVLRCYNRFHNLTPREKNNKIKINKWVFMIIKILESKYISKPGVLKHSYNLSTQEAKAGG
jgi:hypothetical protein